MASWMLSCTKKGPILPLEDRILDPSTLGCQCVDITLEHFLLVGDVHFEKILKLLNQCYEKGLIDSLQEVK